MESDGEILNQEPIEPEIVEVPEKTENETYEQMKYRVACHNSNFLIKIEERVKKWSDAHKGRTRPPIYQDDEGKYFWASRKMRRQRASSKFQQKLSKQK